MARPADRSSAPRRFIPLLLLVLAGLVMVQAPGCSCRTETPAETQARLAKEEAERLERERIRREEELARQPVQLPPAKLMPAGGGLDSVFVKPGHWNAVQQVAKANAEDFAGTITYEVVGKEGRLPLKQGANLRLVSRRPLVVARQSIKSVDSLFYCPPTAKQSTRLKSDVQERRSGATMSAATPLRQLLDHQYHFVVLAAEPERYGFLANMRSINGPIEDRLDVSGLLRETNALKPGVNYHFVAVPIDNPSGEIAIPDNPIAWTSIAYLLWDEVDPALLRPAQREAILDWLNWGGQLIVNGADSIDLLQGSLFEPLLPATSSGVRKVKRSELTRLAAQWSVGEAGGPLAIGQEWTAADLKLAADGRWLPRSDGLLAERRVGRGRIVLSAIDLTDSRLQQWTAGYENLVNGALLRRPPRRFINKAGGYREGIPQVAVRWADEEAPLRIDPFLNTHLRSFVRDTHEDPSQLVLRVTEGSDLAAGGATAYTPSGQAEPSDFQQLAPASVPGGAGAVNDFSLVAQTVRDTLTSSAGVSIPGAGFVIACLAAYLFVLVPANWAFFTAIGRVELAWVAAPVIAILGAWVVIQQAQLDIGFVRSRSEIAILELQPETPRAQLTRFTALYTSLSTTYEMEFDSPAVAMPFARGAATDSPQFGGPATVAYERLDKARLRDLAVSSATTEFVRSDEMLDISEAGIAGSSVPGSIRLNRGSNGETRIENRTRWPLEDVMIVGRPDGLTGDAKLEGCWIGDLGAGQNSNIVFLPIPELGGPKGPLPFAKERQGAARLRKKNEGEERMELEALLRVALDPTRYEPGERRVVARISQIMPGVSIEPKSSQQKGTTLVVGHLSYGPLPPIQPDVNTPADVQ